MTGHGPSRTLCMQSVHTIIHVFGEVPKQSSVLKETLLPLAVCEQALTSTECRRPWVPRASALQRE